MPMKLETRLKHIGKRLEKYHRRGGYEKVIELLEPPFIEEFAVNIKTAFNERDLIEGLARSHFRQLERNITANEGEDSWTLAKCVVETEMIGLERNRIVLAMVKAGDYRQRTKVIDTLLKQKIVEYKKHLERLQTGEQTQNAKMGADGYAIQIQLYEELVEVNQQMLKTIFARKSGIPMDDVKEERRKKAF